MVGNRFKIHDAFAYPRLRRGGGVGKRRAKIEGEVRDIGAGIGGGLRGGSKVCKDRSCKGEK